MVKRKHNTPTPLNNDEKKRKFISQTSDACVSSQLDLLYTPETQAATVAGKWIHWNPIILKKETPKSNLIMTAIMKNILI